MVIESLPDEVKIGVIVIGGALFIIGAIITAIGHLRRKVPPDHVPF